MVDQTIMFLFTVALSVTLALFVGYFAGKLEILTRPNNRKTPPVGSRPSQPTLTQQPKGPTPPHKFPPMGMGGRQLSMPVLSAFGRMRTGFTPPNYMPPPTTTNPVFMPPHIVNAQSAANMAALAAAARIGRIPSPGMPHIPPIPQSALVPPIPQSGMGMGRAFTTPFLPSLYPNGAPQPSPPKDIPPTAPYPTDQYGRGRGGSVTDPATMKKTFQKLSNDIQMYPRTAGRVTKQLINTNSLIKTHQPRRSSMSSAKSSSNSLRAELSEDVHRFAESEMLIHDSEVDEKIPPTPFNLDPTEIPPAEITATVTTVGPRRSRVVIVCYRLPITCKKNRDGSWVCRFNDMRDFLANCVVLEKNYDVHFVGWPGITPESFDDQESLEDALYNLKPPCYPVYLTDKTRELFHSKFCKGILWPLFHYLTPISDQTFAGVYEELWKVYQNVNIKFAKKACVATDSEEDSLIWVHNYHLALVPNFIRRQMPTAQIGFFLHTTFPTSEVFRCIPTRVEILRGMLSSDLIGFHTYDYARHFLSSCKRVLDLDFHTLPNTGTLVVHVLGRDVSLRIGHVSILSDKVKQLALGDRVRRECEKWRQKFGKRKIIVGVGEYEIVRGTILILQAYHRFLSENPNWIKDIAFVLIIRLGDSVTSLQISEEVCASIQKEVKSIKAEFGEETVDLLEELSYVETIALYRAADVGCFCTFWDGFNLMPYSFTAAQVDTDTPATVILSEFMGCMRSMSGALRVNPLKLEDTSRALHTALIMTPQERRVAHNRRYHYVMHYTFVRWAEGFLTDLTKAAEAEHGKNVIQMGMGSSLKWIYLDKDFVPLKEVEKLLLSSFKRCKHRILLFDYGGTLADVDEQNPSVSYHPKSSHDLLNISQQLKCASNRVLGLVDELSQDPNSMVCVVSGHTKSEIATALGDNPRLCLAAEKGAFFRWPDTNRWETNPKLQDCSGWQEIAWDVLRTYTERTDGSYVQKKDTALVWHYHDSDPDYGDMQASELERYLKRTIPPLYGTVVQRYDHGRILEILPGDIHKGSAALSVIEKMVERIGAENLDTQDVFILAVGNDRTDEKMFEAVELAARTQLRTEHTFSVTIGIKPTQARFYLREQREITWLMSLLAGCLRVQKQHPRDNKRPIPPISQTPPQRSARANRQQAPPNFQLSRPAPVQFGGFNMFPLGTGPAPMGFSSFQGLPRHSSNPPPNRDGAMRRPAPNPASMSGSLNNLQALVSGGMQQPPMQMPIQMPLPQFVPPPNQMPPPNVRLQLPNNNMMSGVSPILNQASYPSLKALVMNHVEEEGPNISEHGFSGVDEDEEESGSVSESRSDSRSDSRSESRSSQSRSPSQS